MTDMEIIKNAFSKFLVADMNTPRDVFFDVPEEAIKEVEYHGQRVGRKVRACAVDIVGFNAAAKKVIESFDNRNYWAVEFVEELVLQYNLDTNEFRTLYHYAKGVVDAWRV